MLSPRTISWVVRGLRTSDGQPDNESSGTMQCDVELFTIPDPLEVEKAARIYAA